ncbi:hypothetical protein GQR58_024062 [Nymphon striatum]|nr:hypothetical protein GQR58_024062 [Nymphon striatum]
MMKNGGGGDIHHHQPQLGPLLSKGLPSRYTCEFCGTSVICSTGQVSCPVPLATLHCPSYIVTPCVCPHPTISLSIPPAHTYDLSFHTVLGTRQISQQGICNCPVLKFLNHKLKLLRGLREQDHIVGKPEVGQSIAIYGIPLEVQFRHLNTFSKQAVNIFGDIESPCLTPFSNLILFVLV